MTKTSLLIEALRNQIKPIAIDANLWDLGIADYPYAQKCSIKRKKLNDEILALGGEVKPLPFAHEAMAKAVDSKISRPREEETQLELL